MRGKVRSACVFAALLGLVFLVGCSGDSDEKKVTGGTPTRPVPTVTLTPGPKPGDTGSPKPPTPEGVVSLTAKEYDEEHEKDKVATRKKYQGRTLEVTGVVKEMRQSSDGKAFLRLKGNLSDLRCITRDQAPWNKALPGQTVKLRGTGGSDSLFDAEVVDCDILEVSGNPPPALTADRVSETFAVDPEKTMQKYWLKPVVITGVTEKVEAKGAAVNVTLKKAGKGADVICSFNFHFDERVLKDLKEGRKVKILGTYYAISNGAVVIDDCLLME